MIMVANRFFIFFLDFLLSGKIMFMMTTEEGILEIFSK